MDTSPWPTELRYNAAAKQLSVSYDDGAKVSISAEKLRVESPSAEVRGHGGEPRKKVVGKENVAITRMVPVGRYAVRLIFDDGHETGLYTWSYLRELGSGES